MRTTLGAGNRANPEPVGGTGKLAGLTGSGEFTGTPVRPTSAGNFHGYSKAKVSYKLP